jgi:hypothetical protein
MKIVERYINKYPLEPLLPELDEKEVNKTVKECDYTFEANQICDVDKIDNRVNIADAEVFYTMGYNEAMRIINFKLKPEA